MKKIERYFYTGCVSFFIVNIIIVIMHIISNIETIRIESEIDIFVVIFLIQFILYIMDDIMIKNGILHLLSEFIISCVVVFAIGIPLKFISVLIFSNVISIILIILITYLITIFSLYMSAKCDEHEINNMLSKERR